jgi:hypothetical protein
VAFLIRVATHLVDSFWGGGLYPLAEKLGPISISQGSLGGMFFKFTYTVVCTKTCVVVWKEGVSILYMDFNYVSPSNEGRHIVLVWFFLFLLLSEACLDHNLFVFADRSILFWNNNTSFCRKPFNEHSYHVTFGFNLPSGFRGED